MRASTLMTTSVTSLGRAIPDEKKFDNEGSVQDVIAKRKRAPHLAIVAAKQHVPHLQCQARISKGGTKCAAQKAGRLKGSGKEQG